MRYLDHSLISIPLVCSVISACSSAQQSSPPPAVAAAPQAEQEPGKEEPKATLASRSAELPGDAGVPRFEPLYFDFDSAELRPAAMATLRAVAEYLLKSQGVALTIAGHSDDRGTAEYNLALGEQRASRARDYLVKLGVSPKVLKTVSFGEERPAMAGESEEAWAKNRRNELELVSGASGSTSPSLSTN